MKVSVLLTGMEFKQGGKRKDIVLPEGASVEDLIACCLGDLPDSFTKNTVKTKHYMVNGTFQDSNITLKEADEVRIFQMMLGG